jgi:hypothetical protein
MCVSSAGNSIYESHSPLRLLVRLDPRQASEEAAQQKAILSWGDRKRHGASFGSLNAGLSSRAPRGKFPKTASIPRDTVRAGPPRPKEGCPAPALLGFEK